MRSTFEPSYLSIDRAMEFIGDASGVLTLLKSLHQTLGEDLPRIQALLDQDDLQGANRLLHQLKGFTPVSCVDSLVELVVHVEHLSKHAESAEVQTAYQGLAPQLEALRTEVAQYLSRHPTA
jgi:HPt (histidine-containing phosphotransfer) domain-containing protein